MPVDLLIAVKHLPFRQWLKPRLDKLAENTSERLKIRRPRQRSHRSFELADGARKLRLQRLLEPHSRWRQRHGGDRR